MADPVSSVAYAIEAALDHLDGDLASLWPAMALVVATIAVVAATYHQLTARFPGGGASAEGLATAFGEGWAFLPVGALLVDFTLTIAVSFTMLPGGLGFDDELRVVDVAALFTTWVTVGEVLGRVFASPVSFATSACDPTVKFVT